jgi:hypothetical protein
MLAGDTLELNSRSPYTLITVFTFFAPDGEQLSSETTTEHYRVWQQTTLRNIHIMQLSEAFNLLCSEPSPLNQTANAGIKRRARACASAKPRMTN